MDPGGRQVLLSVDRLTLAKLRWRGAAEDGREFGFDLTEPLEDGEAFFHRKGSTYIVTQLAEPVLEIMPATAFESARAGWLIGNLHFSLELASGCIRVADDPALRQLFAREHIHFSAVSRVFHPLRQSHVH